MYMYVQVDSPAFQRKLGNSGDGILSPYWQARISRQRRSVTGGGILTRTDTDAVAAALVQVNEARLVAPRVRAVGYIGLTGSHFKAEKGCDRGWDTYTDRYRRGGSSPCSGR